MLYKIMTFKFCSKRSGFNWTLIEEIDKIETRQVNDIANAKLFAFKSNY